MIETNRKFGQNKSFKAVVLLSVVLQRSVQRFLRNSQAVALRCQRSFGKSNLMNLQRLEASTSTCACLGARHKVLSLKYGPNVEGRSVWRSREMINDVRVCLLSCCLAASLNLNLDFRRDASHCGLILPAVSLRRRQDPLRHWELWTKGKTLEITYPPPPFLCVLMTYFKKDYFVHQDSCRCI